MRDGGALGTIDDQQGHPGRGSAPGPSMKSAFVEAEPPRANAMEERRNARPEREAGAPWWGYADKTTPWWAR